MTEGYPLIPEDLPDTFKAAMRRLAASVSIVVAKGDEGPVGMAATSITSLTVDPPAATRLRASSRARSKDATVRRYRSR